MKFRDYVIVIFIALVVGLAIDYIRNPLPVDTGGQTSTGRPYHKWVYVDSAVDTSGATVAYLADLAGTKIGKLIVTHKNDEIIFVNRTDTDVVVKFHSDDIFGASNKEFTISPYKRKIRKVTGPPNNYTYTIDIGGGSVGAPDVKVGQDP